MCFKLSIFLLLVLLVSALSAQTEKWKYFNNTNGLPTDRIRCVLQDKKGSYWIGTWDDGLIKYDGKKFTVFNTKNSKLPHNSIYCMVFDKRGNLYIGTFGGGVAKFDCRNNWKIYNTENSGLPNNWIYSIAIDSKGELWIGTYSEGLAIFNGKKWKVYNKFNSKLPDNKVTAIYIAKNGDKIIGTARHSIFIVKNVWKTEKEMNIDTYEDAIYWIAPYIDNKVLMCYKFGSVVIFDWKNYRILNESNSSIPIHGFYSITSDKKNIIWAGSFLLGVVRYDGRNAELWNKENSGLKDNQIFSTFIDSKNNKWFCTYNEGICIYNEDGVTLK